MTGAFRECQAEIVRDIERGWHIGAQVFAAVDGYRCGLRRRGNNWVVAVTTASIVERACAIKSGRSARRRCSGSRDFLSSTILSAGTSRSSRPSARPQFLMDAPPAAMLRRAFDEAQVNPEEITFPDGDRIYLEELVRSIHPATAELAGEFLGERPK